MCIRDEIQCKGTECPFYNLFDQYNIFKNGIFQSYSSFSKQECDNYLCILAKRICDSLEKNATCRGITDAGKLIKGKLFLKVMEVIGCKHFFDLCLHNLEASIALGVTDTDTFDTVTRFQILLPTKKDEMQELDYLLYESRFESLYCQILQKSQEYGKVVDHVNDLISRRSIDIKLVPRIQAQSSASQYLLGREERDNNNINKSKELILSVFDSLEWNTLTSYHYFVMAKMIEHETETQLFSNIERVIDSLKDYIVKSLEDEVASTTEAVDKVIFHRDVYRALKMLGNDEDCKKHLKIARSIAQLYNLLDQMNKLDIIEKNLEPIILLKDSKMKLGSNNIGVTLQKNHKCNLGQPYFFISYSHHDLTFIKSDITRSFSSYNYWIDFENLDGGRCATADDWSKKIEPVLEKCNGAIVYCSDFSICKSVGTLFEAEWLEKNKDKEIYVFLCGFEQSFTPDKAAGYLEAIQVSDPQQSLRRKRAFSYILQADKSLEKYSYYFYSETGEHIENSDFKNWLKRIL